MTETRDLVEVLADWREQATILAAHGHQAQAESIRSVCDAVAAAEGIAAFLDYLTESDAMSKSGKGRQWLRARFPGWLEQGLARWDPRRRGHRQYRSLIIPQRANAEAARAQARRDAAA